MFARAATLLLTLASLADAVDIATCGETVRAGEIGTLRQDLACHGGPVSLVSAHGVRLEAGARLEMNGFAIRGDGTGVGVMCGSNTRRRPCTVNGPGEISGFWAGLNGGGCRFVARGVLIRGNTNGIVGALACDLDATDLNVVENDEDGIWVVRFRGRNVIVSQNGRHGLFAARVNARGLAATHNGAEGVRQFSTRGRFGRIVDSTVIENDAGGAGFDIAAAGGLQLRRVRCRRSARLDYPPVVDSSDDVPTVVGSFGCIDD